MFIRPTVALLSILAAVPAQAPPLAPLMRPEAFEIVTLTEGVHAILRQDPPDDAANANVLVIVGETGVVVADANLTPSSTRATIAAIRTLTPLPVRFVVNTHWHDDHVLGNSEYARAFPGVQIIGHAETRRMVIESVTPALEDNRTAYPEEIRALTARLESGTRRDGTPLTETDRVRLGRTRDLLRAFVAEMPGIRPLAPDVLVDGTLTLWQGTREIRIQFLAATRPAISSCSCRAKASSPPAICS